MRKTLGKILLLILSVLMLTSCDAFISQYINLPTTKKTTTAIPITTTTTEEPVGPTTTKEIDDNITTKTYTGSDSISDVLLFSINDTHGELYGDEDSTRMSLAQVGGIINYLEEEKDQDYIKICAGDLFQGSYVSNMTEGLCMIDALNAMSFDCLVLGNHEFDWGLDVIYQYFDGIEENGEASFPLICCNVFDSSNSNLRPEWIQPYLIIEYYDVKVGIIGAIGADEESQIAASSLGTYWFDTEDQYVKRYAKELRQYGCDVVVLAEHDYTEETLTRLAKLTGDYRIDAFICGHTHQSIETTFSRSDGYRIPTLQSYTKNGNVGTITIKLTNKVPSGYLIAHFNKNFFNQYVLETDSKVDQVLAKYQYKYDEGSEVLYNLPRNLTSKQDIADYMIAAMNYYCNGDIGMVNTGGVRSSSHPSGPVTFADILEWFPFDNKVVYVIMTGEKLIQYYNHKSGMIFNSDFDASAIISTEEYILTTSDYCAAYNNTEILRYTTDGILHNSNIIMYDMLRSYLLYLSEKS